MATYTIEKSRDPNRITVKFLDGSAANYVLRDKEVVRVGIELPQYRELGNVEEAFGKKLLATAERAAFTHFFGNGSKEYTSLLDERAARFAEHVRIRSINNDTESYTTTFLKSLARGFLKNMNWDTDVDTLVTATRSFWARKGAQKKKDEKDPAKEQRALRRAHLRQMRESQINLFG